MGLRSTKAPGWAISLAASFAALILLGAAQAAVGEVDAGKVVVPDHIPGSETIDAEGVIELIDAMPDLILIDARLAEDRKQGFIEGSINLPNIDTDCDRLGELIPSPETPVMFHCNGVKCGRSVKSTLIALECGYSQLYWFRGGIEEWKQNKFPLVQ